MSDEIKKDGQDRFANAPEPEVQSDTAILGLSNANHLEKLYDGWFLDYASYVILDRAVPYFEDGLKPVQRRILHTLFEMNNGKLNKVANVVGATMRCFAMRETIEQMHRIFPYIGETANAIGLFRPMIHFVDNAEPFCVGGLAVERLVVEHGFPCCGYLLGGKLAYISDCHAIPEATLEKMKGVETLVLNCLRERPHPTQLNLEAALGYISRIRPKRAYLTHMCHDLSHVEWLKKLPHGVEPAYDGLELKVED